MLIPVLLVAASLVVLYFGALVCCAVFTAVN